MSDNHEIIKRVSWTLFLVMILAAGQQVILPGVDQVAAATVLKQPTFLSILSSATGGRLNLPTLFSLGLSPYMTTMIVWSAVQSLDLKSINSLSMKKAGLIQRVLVLVLAIVQAITMMRLYASALQPLHLFGYPYDWGPWVTGLLLVAGAMLVTWLADVNSNRGIGSTAIMILPGILLSTPNSLHQGWGDEVYSFSPEHLLTAAVVILLFTAAAVWLYKGEVRLPIQRTLLEGDYRNSYLPIKVLTAGAMPFMFSNSLFSLPKMIIQNTALRWQPIGHTILHWTSYKTVNGMVIYAVVIMLLGYAFGYMNVRPVQTARQLKYAGDYFLNVVPGDDTESFITNHFFLLCTIGNLVEILIGVIPLICGLIWPGVANYSLFLGNIFIVVTIFDNVIEQFRALYSKNRYRLLDL
ncbi:hypothetical protein [Lacticaseibacillus thailandensis]|uniref:Preprotein translocase subunit SecY n=1 Tax=Lacticaseibacillus thailandensis DSM 22698 = JCM 13996 TaxID=1423810 RepID=A0A0R2CB86_9LACO|nr:hypothetical protein [Lacticaseibacillus thailandensis]KRM87284.1 preprotein translocase subunit SecY [Lacticaseibacillus thailandensis DSM 22698 = JCM 13996]